MKKAFLIVLGVITVVFSITKLFNVKLNLKLGTGAIKNAYQEELDGNNIFYNNIGKGITVMNIWATWCKPCIEEIPDLNEIKEEFKESSISFVSLSIDDNKKTLEEYLKYNKLEYQDISLEHWNYRNAILNFLGKSQNNFLKTAIPRSYIIVDGEVKKVVSGKIEKEHFMELLNKVHLNYTNSFEK